MKNLPIKIVEKGDNIECQLHHALLHCSAQFTLINNRCRVIQSWAGHYWTIFIPEKTMCCQP
ncbi:unnamed protein product [Heterobilharzia americana]|nr:unnamed protein product [Heterobilharzia americana]CAH8491740.1 unnamed protein product [Heterobilharzia americana]